MSWLYSARLVPIGQPVSIPDDRGQPSLYTFTEKSFAAEQRCPGNVHVCLNHERGQRIGKLAGLITHGGWWVGDFTLDEALVSELTIGPGTPVSVGLTILDVGTRDPILSELSIVPSSAVDGACIVSRLELKPVTIPAATRTTTAHTTTAPHLGSGHIARRPSGRILRVR